MIPSSGEIIYATEPITRTLSDGAVLPENVNSTGGQCDFLTSLDQLEATAPNCKSVSLVVAWFGNDLRAGGWVCLVETRRLGHERRNERQFRGHHDGLRKIGSAQDGQEYTTAHRA